MGTLEVPFLFFEKLSTEDAGCNPVLNKNC
jgi:hypothetical protein